MKCFVTTAILAGALAFGCKNSAEQKVEDLSEAQQKANANADEARREADIKSAKAYEEANEAIRDEREKVAEKTAEVDKSLVNARDELKRSMEEKLGKLDKRIADVQTKIATKKDMKTPRADLDRSLQSIKDQAATLRSNVPSVDSTDSTTITTTRDNFEARLNQIDKSLDELEDKV